MTLSPVFRSPDAIDALRTAGVWDRFEPASCVQRDAFHRVLADLGVVLDDRLVACDADSRKFDLDGQPTLAFTQEFFFLIFFLAVLESLGSRREALAFYGELNVCIKGLITASDNLFDDQQKSMLPLAVGPGRRFASILELLTFQRLLARVFERAIAACLLSPATSDRIQQELMSRMASIGALEGSEEDGVNEALDVEHMIERVHRLRGGALFQLGLVAPRHVEAAIAPEVMARVEQAIAGLGTAFQMIDDLIDIEFDVTRGRHNLLAAWVHQHGSVDERAALAELRTSPGSFSGLVERRLGDSARHVLARAADDTRRCLEDLQAAGFWFPPSLADRLVRALVGVDGVARMAALST